MSSPELEDLLGAYFHCSWPSDYATPADAVDACLRGGDEREARLLADDIDRFLKDHPTEPEAIAAFDAMASGLALEDGEHITWFREVAAKARLRAAEL